MSRRTFIRRGLVAVTVAAVALSFSGLFGLAQLAAFDWYVAWLLPSALDIGTIISSAVWTDPDAPPRARSYARGLTLTFLTASVGGNAVFHALVAYRVVVPWYVVASVASAAPIVAVSTAYLIALLDHADEPEPEPPPERTVDTSAGAPKSADRPDVDAPDRPVRNHEHTRPTEHAEERAVDIAREILDRPAQTVSLAKADRPTVRQTVERGPTDRPAGWTADDEQLRTVILSEPAGTPRSQYAIRKRHSVGPDRAARLVASLTERTDQ